MPDESELIPDFVLAEILDLTVATIRRYTREDKIPYTKQGDQYRYHLQAVVDALAGTPGGAKAERKKYTYQDYLEIPVEPGCRYEVLNGELIQEPSPSVIHQRVSRRLQRILEDYFWKIDPKGEIFNAPLDTTLNNNTVVQPDIMYISGEQREIIKESRIDGAPCLAIEIISSSSRSKDSIRKLQIYQHSGVQHYWLVDPEKKTLQCFANYNDRFELAAYGLDEDVVNHPDFAGLSLALGHLWKS